MHHPQRVIRGGPRSGTALLEKSSAQVGWKQEKSESKRFGRPIQGLAARTRSIRSRPVHLQLAGSNMNLMISDISEDLNTVAFWQSARASR